VFRRGVAALIQRLCPQCHNGEVEVEEGGEWTRLIMFDGLELCVVIRYRGADPATAKIPVSSRPPHVVFAVAELPGPRCERPELSLSFLTLCCCCCSEEEGGVPSMMREVREGGRGRGRERGRLLRERKSGDGRAAVCRRR